MLTTICVIFVTFLAWWGCGWVVLWTPCFRIKKWYFYILVLELLALLRVEEELREREFFWPIWKFRCFKFSTFAGLRVNDNFVSIALLSYVQGGLLPDLCPCLPGIACGHPITISRSTVVLSCVTGGYKLCIGKRIKIQWSNTNFSPVERPKTSLWFEFSKQRGCTSFWWCCGFSFG